MTQHHQRYEKIVREILDPTGRRTSKLCLKPYLYDEHFRERMTEITKSYARLLEFVFHNLPTDKRIQQVLAYPPDLEKFLNSLQIYEENLAAARIDIFVNGDQYQMVESNAEIPGGNEESYFLEQEYLKIYEPKGLTAVPRMQIVYDMLMKYYGVQAKHFHLPATKNLNIVLTQWQSEIDRIRGEYDILMNFVRKRGHRCDVIDPNQVMIRDNKAYLPDGKRIDLIYRRFTADELPKFAKKSWQMAIDWDKAEVAVINPFCTKRVDSKNIMVLFADPDYTDVFPPDLQNDLKVVREIIPWTKKIVDRLVLADGTTVDARPFLLEKKDSLVIKHANAYSSAAVYLGEDQIEAMWQEIVDESLKGDWIVQEKIDLPEMDIEYFEAGKVKTARCIYNVNPYIYDGKLGGFLARASTDKLTSFKTGEIATIVPCFQSIKE